MMLKYIPFTTLLLTYLFVCGSLYLVGFWSTFEIDVFSLISLYDIPKNFVFPLMLSQVAYVIGMITGHYLYQFEFVYGKEDNDNFIYLNPEWSSKKYRIMNLITSISFWLGSIVLFLPLFFEKPYMNIFYWAITTFIISYFLLYKFVTSSFIKSYIVNAKLRLYIGHFMTIFPVACFSTGKISSLNLYNNHSSKFFDTVDIQNTTKINDPKCLKFLGFISDKYIYSTIDNNSIYILNKEAIPGIVISKN